MDTFPPRPCLPCCSVPCLSRASEIERYDPKSEFALAGEEDGWVATHQDPTADTATAAGAADDMPDLDEAAGTLLGNTDTISCTAVDCNALGLWPSLAGCSTPLS
jgi:hypothetical protein